MMPGEFSIDNEGLITVIDANADALQGLDAFTRHIQNQARNVVLDELVAKITAYYSNGKGEYQQGWNDALHSIAEDIMHTMKPR